MFIGAFLVAQQKRICLPKQEMQVRLLGWEDPLEKEIATHSSILFFFHVRQVICQCHKVWREAHVMQQHEHPIIMLTSYKRIHSSILP